MQISFIFIGVILLPIAFLSFFRPFMGSKTEKITVNKSWAEWSFISYLISQVSIPALFIVDLTQRDGGHLPAVIALLAPLQTVFMLIANKHMYKD